MKDIYVFITVREQSSRLNQKCLRPLGKKNSVIDWVHARLSSMSSLMPIICTGEAEKNKNIVKYATKNNIQYYCGPENNKVKRWHECAQYFNVEEFHTLDCDDPFFDSNRIIESMHMLNNRNAEIILPSNYSDSGGATEGFSIKTKSLHFSENLDDSADTEMCYSYFKDKLNSLILPNPSYEIENIRLTLDYEKDYEFLNDLANLFEIDADRRSIEKYISSNFKETPNYSCNALWKTNQNNITEKTYENFSRTK